ncbi:hypothetical protein IMCC3135_04125 [Granulosicoccus antarcticus IMCC3135]|uniref:Uncharacterized protein n=1 Tax=Granulosicoccus antarcticus IMCC3135 TaxID=1192854 RepID=A0A2Z2NMC8_9GAMM|nr:hypothetical protein IMCC3135_04125 [Granulosicoccus antarcticus IMCC3135]
MQLNKRIVGAAEKDSQLFSNRPTLAFGFIPEPHVLNVKGLLPLAGALQYNSELQKTSDSSQTDSSCCLCLKP